MPTYLFYPSRSDGVSLTFIAGSAEDDVDALELARQVASAHDCVGVFVWEPSAAGGKDRFVGEVARPVSEKMGVHEKTSAAGASAAL